MPGYAEDVKGIRDALSRGKVYVFVLAGNGGRQRLCWSNGGDHTIFATSDPAKFRKEYAAFRSQLVRVTRRDHAA